MDEHLHLTPESRTIPSPVRRWCERVALGRTHERQILCCFPSLNLNSLNFQLLLGHKPPFSLLRIPTGFLWGKDYMKNSM